jgi:hypothetical protein
MGVDIYLIRGAKLKPFHENLAQWKKIIKDKGFNINQEIFNSQKDLNTSLLKNDPELFTYFNDIFNNINLFENAINKMYYEYLQVYVINYFMLYYLNGLYLYHNLSTDDYFVYLKLGDMQRIFTCDNRDAGVHNVLTLKENEIKAFKEKLGTLKFEFGPFILKDVF